MPQLLFEKQFEVRLECLPHAAIAFPVRAVPLPLPDGAGRSCSRSEPRPNGMRNVGTCESLPVSMTHSGLTNQMETAVRIEGVWKTFGSTRAVCGLSLSVPPQSV